MVSLKNKMQGLLTMAQDKLQPGVLDFKEAFDGYVDSIQKVWDHDRSVTLGASETFGCLRKSFFAKNDGEVDPDDKQSWGAMERGNVMEDYWVVPAMDHYLPRIKADILFGGDDQVTFVANKNSATPDGLIIGLPKNALSKYGIDDIESDCVGFEIKSIDPRGNLDEPKDIHVGQCQVQMGITHAMQEHKPMYTVLMYVNCSFYDEITIFIIKFDENVWRSAKVRANMLFKAKKAEDLKPEGKITEACKFCNYKYACAAASKSTVPVDDDLKGAPDETLDEVFLLVEEERELDAQIKQDTKRQKELKSDIKEALTEVNSRRIGDERFLVSWSFQDGRKTYDTKQMIADGMDISEYLSEGAGFDKMNIKLKKPK